ncbi:anaerobic selenocysteine-containing dehydrogenase [Pullulanibacillus pueri]|uniref:Molybdopterin oxidoreductase n=1 Tax=Pullulanibacillus pueri TaxID=1437324 RepID=A0A8J3EKX2_9BACL|nr:molybdopterin-dependent oxidoreductase [Pullulanibacillus pueri]MBM7680079.1 anaerobic selenocysteine-containing dehydrogenase [Pullulanibacillus pueri]GGH74264.1 molybdopterin oxidoreductase [Pullulanibacillus pueri]
MSWIDSRIDLNIYSQGEINQWIYSTCNICSIGCGCYIAVKDNKIVGIKGNSEHPINRGRLDPKGENQWYANNSPDRLLLPLKRDTNGELVETTWDDAFTILVNQAKRALKNYGPNGVAIYSTGQATLETYYTIAKIGRAGLRSHLLDANTRLCTATTEWGLLESFGSDGVPACYQDIDVTETLFLIGHNPAETGTVLFERIMERKKRTGKPFMIVVDPRKTLTAKEANCHLQLLPGTNVALLNGLIHLIIKNNDINKSFIKQHTIHFNQLVEAVQEWTPEKTAKETGIPVKQLELAAEQLGKTPSLVTTTLQGTYQSADATTTTVDVNNLHLIRGLIGRPGCGPLHMAGQPSSSANRTVGGVGSYPGNRNPNNPQHVKEIAQLWNVPISHLEVGPEKGIEEILHLMEEENIGLFWNIQTNPMVSLPNRKRAKKAFEKTFVVVQDPFLTETTEVADLVLPPAMWGEKDGTMENADRTINLLKKAIDPPANVLPDFDILLEFARRMDFRDRDNNPLISYTTPKECFEEWKRVSKGRPSDMSGITYEKLEKYNGLQWPVNEEHPLGTPRLYTDLNFHTTVDAAQSYGKDLFNGRERVKEEYEALNANGKAILYPTIYLPPIERPSEEYPLWLTTGRLVWHWHTRTKTGRSPALQMVAPEGYVEINPIDADRLDLLPGEVVRLISARGWIEVPTRIVDTVQPGLVFVPFHYGSWEAHQAANEITVDFTDPLSKQPTFKQSACRIEKRRKKIKITSEENLISVAKNYNLTVNEIARANKMTPPFRSDIGQEIEIPLSKVNVTIPPYMPYRKVERYPHFKQAKFPVTKIDLQD